MDWGRKYATMTTDAGGNLVEADTINPQHYKGAGGLEVIDVIEAFGLQHDYYLATAIKYILRAGKKSISPAYEDVEKAQWFLDRFLAQDPQFMSAIVATARSLSETKQTEHLAEGIEDSGESARVRSSE